MRESLVHDLVVAFDETEDAPKSVVINSSTGTIYRLITVILLAISCLLLLVVVIFKYCMKRELEIQILLLH